MEIFNDKTRRRAMEAALAYLPRSAKFSLYALGESVRGFFEGLSEIRLRALGTSYAVFDGHSIPLTCRIDKEGLSSVLYRICREALYAYRDSISEGYVSMEWGVRVGVIGRARYDGGRLIGACDVSSLIFRIPTGRCDFAPQLYDGWRALGSPNMLIASAPLGGKTTALRALAALIGSGAAPRRVAVVDGRCEFIPEDYAASSVDLIRGYDRKEGINIAIRTAAPEVLIADEICTAEECEAMLSASGTGVTVIASAHLEGAAALRQRVSLFSLLSQGMFGCIAHIYRENGEYRYRLSRLGAEITV